MLNYSDNDSVDLEYEEDFNDAVLKYEFKCRQEEMARLNKNKSGFKISAEYKARLRAKMLAEKEAMDKQMMKEKDQDLIKYSTLGSYLKEMHVTDERGDKYSFWADLGSLPLLGFQKTQLVTDMQWR